MSEDEALRTAIALVTATRHGDADAPQMAYDLTANRDDAFAVMAALLGIVVGVVSEVDMRKFAQAAALEGGTRP